MGSGGRWQEEIGDGVVWGGGMGGWYGGVAWGGGTGRLRSCASRICYIIRHRETRGEDLVAILEQHLPRLLTCRTSMPLHQILDTKLLDQLGGRKGGSHAQDTCQLEGLGSISGLAGHAQVGKDTLRWGRTRSGDAGHAQVWIRSNTHSWLGMR